MDAILENKLHALVLTAARCLKERTHKAAPATDNFNNFELRLFVAAREQKNNCSAGARDYAPQIENLKRYIEFILVRPSF